MWRGWEGGSGAGTAQERGWGWGMLDGGKWVQEWQLGWRAGVRSQRGALRRVQYPPPVPAPPAIYHLLRLRRWCGVVWCGVPLLRLPRWKVLCQIGNASI